LDNAVAAQTATDEWYLETKISECELEVSQQPAVLKLQSL